MLLGENTMSREIKFRQYVYEIKFRQYVYENDSKIDGKMLDWDDLLSGTEEHLSCVFSTNFSNASELMQYTGLKDKDGKEIYEGDILRDEYGSRKVKWIMEHCAFLVFATNPSRYIAMESDGQLKNTEIIGNIYENPELLEVK